MVYSLFFLILLPEAITIEVGGSLPSLSIHRFIFAIMFFYWLTNREIVLKSSRIPFLGCLFFFTIVTFVSVFLSPDKVVSIKRFLYFFIETVLFYIVVASSFDNVEDFSPFVKAVALSLSIVAIIGIVERYTEFNPTSYFGLKSGYEFRHSVIAGRDLIMHGSRATYEHRILFGIGMAVLLSTQIFMITNYKRRIYSNIFFLVIAATALYFAQSRGPWLALILSFIFISMFSPKKYAKVFATVSAIGLLIFSLRPGVFQSIEALFLSTLNEHSIKGASYGWRYIVLNTAWSKIESAPSILYLLFGYGHASRFLLSFDPVLLPTGHWAEMNSWDMEYAVILLEHGILGLFTIVLFYALIFFRGTIAYLHTRNIYVLLSLSTILIFAFMKTNVKIFAPQLVYLEMFFVGILSANINRNTPTNKSRPQYSG